MNRGGSKGCGKETNEEREKTQRWVRIKVEVVVNSKNAKSAIERERGKEKKVRGGGRALQKGTMMIHYFLGFCKLFLKSCLVCLWLSYPLSYKVRNPKSSSIIIIIIIFYYLYILFLTLP